MTKEDDNFKKVDGLFSFLAYVLRFRLKEFLTLVIVCLLGYILISNVGCNKDGPYWQPSVKIEVKK